LERNYNPEAYILAGEKRQERIKKINKGITSMIENK
jgi:hypothetical protein